MVFSFKTIPWWLSPHLPFHNNESALEVNEHVCDTGGRWQEVPCRCNSHSVRKRGATSAIVLPPLVFLLIRVLQWPLLLLLSSIYKPFIPTGVTLKRFIVCFQTWHSKIKVVLFLYLSLLNPWVIPSFFYCQSQGPGGLRHFALLAPLTLQTILEKDGHMFILEPRGLVRLSTFPSQGDRKSPRNTQRFMRSENNNFLIGFI